MKIHKGGRVLQPQPSLSLITQESNPSPLAILYLSGISLMTRGAVLRSLILSPLRSYMPCRCTAVKTLSATTPDHPSVASPMARKIQELLPFCLERNRCSYVACHPWMAGTFIVPFHTSRRDFLPPIAYSIHGWQGFPWMAGIHRRHASATRVDNFPDNAIGRTTIEIFELCANDTKLIDYPVPPVVMLRPTERRYRANIRR